MEYPDPVPEADIPPPPYSEADTKSISSITSLKRLEAVVCQTCGQFHEPNGTHLYDYHTPVDEDLLCHICLQPLVNPIDTKCGHTFCSRCLKNYLLLQQQCPVDRQPLTISDCQKSSILVRRLLDKLLVVCPNVHYCEEVLPRAELDAHLIHRCRGAITRCIKASLGCTFQGPRSALQSHLWECPYRDQESGKNPVIEGEVSTIEIQRHHAELGISIVGGCDTPLSCLVIQEVFSEGEVAKDGRLKPGDQILECELKAVVLFDVYKAHHGERLLCHLKENGIKLLCQQHVQISYNLGIFVNKFSKDELKLHFHEGYSTQVNGEDLTQATHYHAKKALCHYFPVCRLTVYREKAEENTPIEKEEILKITLTKVKGKQLGIKLVGKRNGAGVYLLNLVPNGLACLDGRLRPDDRLLEINGMDVAYGTQEQAARLIQSSPDKVQFVVSRKSRPQTPDIIRSTSDTLLGTSTNSDCDDPPWTMCRKSRERIIALSKDPQESLGVSVAGGIGSPRGDTPVYITNLNLQGCLGRSGQIKKGDVLLSINGMNLLGLSHTDAVNRVRVNAETKQVTLKIIEAPETTEGPGNFAPTWLFWQQLPRSCQTVKTVTLLRSPTGSLGFSVVGGCDCSQGNLPIFIKSIVLDTPASKDGRLKCGDIILSVNEHSLVSVTHTRAVELLKTIDGAVTLAVVSWPGTVV